jgi:hypothetical protein
MASGLSVTKKEKKRDLGHLLTSLNRQKLMTFFSNGTYGILSIIVYGDCERIID